MNRILSAIALFATACVSDPAVPDGGGTDSSTSGDGTTGTDAGSGDSGGDGMTAWDPSQLSTLVLWLDADTAVKSVNGTTDTWTDKSSFKTNAKAIAQIQQPVVIAPAQGINNHQTLKFDGVNTYMTIADAANLRWKNQFVLEIVFRHAVASASEGGAMFAKTSTMIPVNGAQVYLGTGISQPFNASIEFSVVSGTFVSYKPASPINGNAHRLRAQFDGSNITLQIDSDTPLVKASAMNFDAQGIDAYIGKVAGYAQFAKCEMAEIVALAGMSIPATDVTKLQAYLDTKYGL